MAVMHGQSQAVSLSQNCPGNDGDEDDYDDDDADDGDGDGGDENDGLAAGALQGAPSTEFLPPRAPPPNNWDNTLFLIARTHMSTVQYDNAHV